MPQPALMESLRRWDPEQIGGYTLIGRLGSGAMGQVYLGRSAAGRLVAIKTIKTELAEEPDFRTRFGQEVAAARRVSGAFTAAVIAADSEADVPWLATVYVPAPSLSGLVSGCGPLPVPAVRWLAAGCAEALESIHSAGLVHRDLKPSNVLVSPDGPRVIDFGVARAAERIQLTVTRGAVGTPAYMAPEQARDTRQATAASDVYALGATMLFAGTGHAPYHGETVIDVLVRLATEPPDISGLPAELADVVVSCLDREPLNRPTCASLLARLAPDLATADGLGSAPLPQPALALIEEYRQAPGSPPGANADGPGEATVGSFPRRGDAGTPSVWHPLAARHAPAREQGRPAAARWLAAAWRPGRQRVILAATAGVVAAGLVAGGWAIGNAAASSRRTQLGPVLPPPGGAGTQPPTGAGPGARSIGLNQDLGDSNTVFVVHGQGWPVGERVNVALVGVRQSPIHPIVDDAGTFSYAINQDHEFFRGGLPPGVYTVRVTVASGASATARFEVQRGPPH